MTGGGVAEQAVVCARLARERRGVQGVPVCTHRADPVIGSLKAVLQGVARAVEELERGLARKADIK